MAAAGATVTVACKFPSGIILRTFRMVDGFEPVFGGGTRPIKKSEQVGDPITIKGPATPFGVIPSEQIIGGYALTPNVPIDIWKSWLADNADTPMVKNRLIFAFEKEDAVRGEAKDCSDVRSGLEPLNPAKIIKNGQMVPVDPRIPARIERGERA